MGPKSFLDANILIYSVDRADSAKQDVAISTIERHAREKTGVLSTQVLQEFYSAATRKLGIEPLEARQLVRDFRIFDTVQVTPELIEEGINCSILNRISFWDGLIVASAVTARCSEILSEDLTGGQAIQGVRVRNPFG